MINSMLTVHFQYIPDEGKLAKKIAETKKPILISLVPNLFDRTMKTKGGEEIYRRIHPPENYYPGWFAEWVRTNKQNPFLFWAMEGCRHCCGRCADEYDKNVAEGKGKFPDRHHEHVCLEGDAQSFEEQRNVIEYGLTLLAIKTGLTLENFSAYCPPNHLWNKDTLKAVEEIGFKGFVIRNAFDYVEEARFIERGKDMNAYKEGELIMFPESKHEGRSPLIYRMYDALTEEELSKYSRTCELTGISDIPVRRKSLFGVIEKINHQLLMKAKRERDKRAMKK